MNYIAGIITLDVLVIVICVTFILIIHKQNCNHQEALNQKDIHYKSLLQKYKEDLSKTQPIQDMGLSMVREKLLQKSEYTPAIKESLIEPLDQN